MPHQNHTFENAAASYIRQGGSPRYVPRVTEYFRGRPVTSITPAEIRQMAIDLYPPETHMASTRNRHALAPARAVLYHAHELGWCHPLRIRTFRHPRSTKHKPVNRAWLSIFVNQCEKDKLPHLAALVVFMNQTAARISEAVALTGEWVDLRQRTATLVKTKTDVMAVAILTDEIVDRLQLLDLQPGKRAFKYKSRWSVNDRIRAVCRRAGIDYYSSHSVGRHSFATNAIKLGVGIRPAMVAGRWKTASLFMETYAHAEYSSRLVADALNRYRYMSL